MSVSLNEIAELAGVSVKTVSGALHGGSVRMSDRTRLRVRKIADELGYVTNFAARSMRVGWMPLIGVIADELVTSPFATGIIAGLDNVARASDMAVFAMTLGGRRTVASVLGDMQQFRPRAVAYAAMYHKTVELPADLAQSIGVLINCRDADGRVTSLVPDETGAALVITNYLLNAGRRNIAFITLPGLLAGELRELGFRQGLDQAGLKGSEAIVLPAVKRPSYNGRGPSLVLTHVQRLMSGPQRPDAILCGNDRVAMEVYSALRRCGATIPDDIAVASFDNQVDIALRLDPPLTTMALPHQEMGRKAAQILLAADPAPVEVKKIPFRLVKRSSI